MHNYIFHIILREYTFSYFFKTPFQKFFSMITFLLLELSNYQKDNLMFMTIEICYHSDNDRIAIELVMNREKVYLPINRILIKYLCASFSHEIQQITILHEFNKKT